ncbi:MAG: saccharopine dehydrogenase C-terminal domain-containing protein [Gammaproteobacteria bacterium]|nr:saccharopine dehydrogenase C-terminal domain-containing protein [Gammaproteobacteria bacterium]
MQRILVLGAGKIGSLIAFLLANCHDYDVYLADIHVTERPDLENIKAHVSHLKIIALNAQDAAAMDQFLTENPMNAVISALPYYHNIPIAQAAKKFNLHYFDLTEDTYTAQTVLELAEDAKTAFIPQCGLAPGFISIVANNLMQHFPKLDSVKMRVGALPVNISNALQYSLTWSTDGLINEYGNLCHAIEDGEEVSLLPLDDLEEIKIDGLTYEAFNTSGGIGTLAKTYANKVKHLSYKTIRYPGHCAKMHFLMNDLNLNHDRETLKHILEGALPKTHQDVVLVYVSVTGTQDNQFIEENYVKKLYPTVINEIKWSAIQMTTASSICAIVDLTLSAKDTYRGMIRQETFSLDAVLQNRFGQYYAQS